MTFPIPVKSPWARLLPETGSNPQTLAPGFGKRTKERVEEIDQFLETLRSLGQL